MTYQLIAEGDRNLHEIGNYDAYFRHGDRGYLELHLAHTAVPNLISQLDQALRLSEITNYQIVPHGNRLQIHFQKNSPGLGTIAVIIVSLTVLAVLVVGWQLFKASPGLFVAWTVAAIVAVVLIVVAVAAVTKAVTT